MSVDAVTILQSGGVLAFATVVYLQLREQTKVLLVIARTMQSVLERQDVIQENQKRLAVHCERHGATGVYRAIKDLPAKPAEGTPA